MDDKESRLVEQERGVKTVKYISGEEECNEKHA